MHNDLGLDEDVEQQIDEKLDEIVELISDTDDGHTYFHAVQATTDCLGAKLSQEKFCTDVTLAAISSGVERIKTRLELKNPYSDTGHDADYIK